ncbi:MAG: guanylate kinase [Anaplasmataceae bacterium]|nr:guanylate kinase [Anaplasmataceae bacterium]
MLIIISAPSGTGKTTIVDRILKLDKSIKRSISMTTRPMRSEEIESVDYFFKKENEFLELCKTNEILEYAKVCNYYYGTPRNYIDENLKNNIDIICNIDWQGGVEISKHMNNVVKIFLLPPSLKELQTRLQDRNLDSAKEINSRLIHSVNEMNQCDKYDYLVINDDLEHTVNKVYKIIQAERHKASRLNIPNIIENITSDA